MTATGNRPRRVFYLDVLRAFACLLVVMIHVSSKFVVKDFGSLNFWVGDILDSLSRIAVPLFVMISGSIFLDENYNFTKDKLFRHVKKMAVFFIFWSLFYSLYYYLLIPLKNHNDIHIKKIILNAILGHYHLWFCYMIIGLYLIVPLLRLWIKKENIKEVKYFIILSLIFSMFLPSIIEFLSLLVPSFKNLNSVLGNLSIKYVGGYTAYFILGWYLNNYEIKHKKTTIVLGLLGIATSIFGTAFLSIKFQEFNHTCNNLSAHIAFQAIMIFMLVKNYFTDEKVPKQSTEKLVGFVAKNSLGVYAVHVVILKYATTILTKLDIHNALLYIPLAYIFTLTISLAISFIFSKIPILKKVV